MASMTELQRKLAQQDELLAQEREAHQFGMREVKSQFFTVLHESQDKLDQLQHLCKQASKRRDQCEEAFEQLVSENRILRQRLTELKEHLAFLERNQDAQIGVLGEMHMASDCAMEEAAQREMQRRDVVDGIHQQLVSAQAAEHDARREAAAERQYLHQVVAEMSELLIRGKKSYDTLKARQQDQMVCEGQGDAWDQPYHATAEFPDIEGTGEWGLPEEGWPSAANIPMNTMPSDMDLLVAEAEAEMLEEQRKSASVHTEQNQSAAAHKAVQGSSELEQELLRTRAAMGDIKRLRDLIHTACLLYTSPSPRDS
eukprot:TRINITY_DN61216_c0_g2_i1.p1 TRINITY_DN61216_c0_g2~~TRINITY_DN61216_c0_g2_i1.p1  ORF type:complete len:313 (-),score=109.74 TRINITY_DN61216_c0_g2_i1:116-1054(-)